MSGDAQPEVSALAINVTIPEPLRWTDTRRGEAFTLTGPVRPESVLHPATTPSSRERFLSARSPYSCS